MYVITKLSIASNLYTDFILQLQIHNKKNVIISIVMT